jgi:hypothetical protein
MLNKQAFTKIDLDIKKLKSDVYGLFENFENKQNIQMDNVKYVLEHSGSKRLNRLSKRILGRRFEKERTGLQPQSLPRPEAKQQLQQPVQEKARLMRPTNQEMKEASKELRRQTAAKNDNDVLTINEDSEEEYSKNNSSKKDDNDPKARRISVLERKDLQPVLNANKKASNYLKLDDFQLNDRLEVPQDKATIQIENLKRNLAPEKNNSLYEDENFILKNVNKPRRMGKFFYD